MKARLAVGVCLFVAACGGSGSADGPDTRDAGDELGSDALDATTDADVPDNAAAGDADRDGLEDARDDIAEDTAREDASDAADSGADGEADADVDSPGRTLVAVTFNSGSGATPPSREPNFGYGPLQKAYSDEWYGNGLAWTAFVEQTAAFFADVHPDVVVFQEVFWPGECEGIPSEARTGFVCQALDDGGPPLPMTVVELVLGEGYQVMCHPGNPDKCAAVRRAFGAFRGCDADVCLDGMDGRRVDGCGGGARVAAATVDLAAGGELRVVNVHGTSGFSADDADCRVRQIDAIFVGSESAPALVAERGNLVLGDFNTDPGRLTASDPSARRWLDFAGEGRDFRFLTAIGSDAPPTYALFNIDHVVSDVLTGSCEHPRPVSGVYFDHLPAVCSLRLD